MNNLRLKIRIASGFSLRTNCLGIVLGLGLLSQSVSMQAGTGEQEPLSLKGNRFLTFNTIIY